MSTGHVTVRPFIICCCTSLSTETFTLAFADYVRHWYCNSPAIKIYIFSSVAWRLGNQTRWLRGDVYIWIISEFFFINLLMLKTLYFLKHHIVSGRLWTISDNNNGFHCSQVSSYSRRNGTRKQPQSWKKLSHSRRLLTLRTWWPPPLASVWQGTSRVPRGTTSWPSPCGRRSVSDWLAVKWATDTVINPWHISTKSWESSDIWER